jgi:hypothetical protein
VDRRPRPRKVASASARMRFMTHPLKVRGIPAVRERTRKKRELYGSTAKLAFPERPKEGG